MNIRLNQCHEGDSVKIIKMHGSGAFKTRLMELGFIRGKIMKIVKYAPLQDPMELFVTGSLVSLRIEEAMNIEVEIVNEEADEEY